MSFDSIRAAFEALGPVRLRGDNDFVTTCPAHDDHNASLNVTRKPDGGTLVRCFVGCQWKAIVAGLGLPPGEWFAPKADRQPSREWTIRDRAGAAVAVHRRFDKPDGSKVVLWFGPDGRTPSKRGTACVIDPRKLPLYGVHDLPPTGPVVVTEGEKAADAIRSRGIPAVGTVCGASGTPCDESLSVLAGRDVVLWPDNDEPGRVHMARIAGRLPEPPRVVEWADAPPKGDAADCDDPAPLIAAAVRIAPRVVEDADEPNTDLGVARRFIARHGQNFRCASGIWHQWDSSRWAEDSLGAVYHVIAEVARSVAVAAGGDEITAKAARKQESSSRIEGSAKVASRDPRIAVSLGDFDRPPHLLAFKNAVVDLRTGVALAPLREHMLTARVPHDFDPSARAPRWERFLVEIMAGRRDLVDFLRRWIGYCMTGDVSEQVILIATGPGQNGKGTLVEVLMRAIGQPLADAAPEGLLIASRNERHPVELMDLRGRRFVVASEVKKGSTFSESRVKWLTGGDTIKARGMHQNFTSFIPTHKIMVLANHMPTVRDATHAFWRRLRVLPYDVKFAQDRSLLPSLMSEIPGILAWCVRAAVEWYRDGLGSAATIDAASSEYRDREDLLGRFLKVYEPPDGSAGLRALHESFKAWAQAAGEDEPRGGKSLAADLESHGWTSRHTNGGNIWSPPGAPVARATSEPDTSFDFGHNLTDGLDYEYE